VAIRNTYSIIGNIVLVAIIYNYNYIIYRYCIDPPLRYPQVVLHDASTVPLHAATSLPPVCLISLHTPVVGANPLLPPPLPTPPPPTPPTPTTPTQTPPTPPPRSSPPPTIPARSEYGGGGVGGGGEGAVSPTTGMLRLSAPLRWRPVPVLVERPTHPRVGRRRHSSALGSRVPGVPAAAAATGRLCGPTRWGYWGHAGADAFVEALRALTCGLPPTVLARSNRSSVITTEI